MLDHLLAQEQQPLTDAALSFVPYDRAKPDQILNAKINTDDWLKGLGAEDPAPVDATYEAAMAAQVFSAYASPEITPEKKKNSLMDLRTPESVRKMVGMLSAYEWSFVEHAQEIRTYIVTSLLDETKNAKPEVRLKALKMLGEVTEVALFTTRVETVTKDLSDEQVEAEIRRRLDRLTVDTPVIEAQDLPSFVPRATPEPPEDILPTFTHKVDDE